MEQWIADGRIVIGDRGRSLIPQIAEQVGFSKDCTAGLRGILKRVVRAGNSDKGTPAPYAECLVHYQYRPSVSETSGGMSWDDMYLQTPAVDASEENEPLEVVVGAGQVAQGFDEILVTMLEGEVCDAWLDPAFAFRDNSLRTAKGLIPPNSPVILRLELVEFQNPLTPRSRIHVADEKHKRWGNDAFRQGLFDVAMAHYQKALKTLGSTLVCGSGLSGEERSAVVLRDREVRLAVLGNMSACAFQTSQLEKATQFIDRALKLSPLHLRTVTRKIAILKKLQRFDEARELIRKVQAGLMETGEGGGQGATGGAAESSAALRAELSTLAAEEAEHQKAANSLFRKML